MDPNPLRDVKLFAGASAEDLDKLTGLIEECFLAKDGILFYEGQLGSTLYVIVSGSVVVTKSVGGDNQHRIDIGQIGPGDVIGDMSLVRDQPRSCTVQALENSEFLALSTHRLGQIRHANLELWTLILTNSVNILSSRLERMNDALSRRLAEEPKNTFVRALLGMSR